ncbi:hypothetical protein OsI_38230 [Oryza sativa Indica Group]|uniref:Retrotransposon protein, putative, unclassified n=1 Tax=Oryza sativa subsp. indica TaxID=39946 RepID=A2ZK76_ORYSI|nr:hypothetical protein OsI_38230 [Oryza sativa Indica Group]
MATADDTASYTNSPTAAVLDSATDAAANAVRAAFQSPDGLSIAADTATIVADGAAAKASAAARQALSTFLASLPAPTPPVDVHAPTTTTTAMLPVGTSAPPSGEPATPVDLTALFAAAGLPPPGSAPAHYSWPKPSVLPGFPHGVHGSGPSHSAAPAPVLDPDTSAALHAQAISVLNVKALVPVTLDVAAANYTKWRGLFLVALGKYALTEHVLSDEHLPHRADWKQMDCVVLAWLYCTISADLLQEVLSVDTTARLVWITLEHQFLGNCEHRAITLTADFHHFQQGDLNVADFCNKLKAMADQLGDLGEPVKDRTLVLTALNGLSEQYSHFRSLVAMQQPFPCFAALRTQLHLEELPASSRSLGCGVPRRERHRLLQPQDWRPYLCTHLRFRRWEPRRWWRRRQWWRELPQIAVVAAEMAAGSKAAATAPQRLDRAASSPQQANLRSGLAHSIHGPALYICGRDPWAVASSGRDRCRPTLLVQL